MFPTAYTCIIDPGEFPVMSLAAIDMEDFVKTDIQSVPGVRSVQVRLDGKRLLVDIAVRDLEFETCKPVYAKELAFYNEFPSHDFQFNVMAV